MFTTISFNLNIFLIIFYSINLLFFPQKRWYTLFLATLDTFLVLCCERPRPRPVFMDVGPNPREWVESCYCVSKWRSTDYIFPLRLGVLQWSRQLFNYWKNKKTIIKKFLILLIWNWIYIDHRKITWLCFLVTI